MVYVGVVNKQRYPTDLSDSQWMIIQEFIPAAKSGGRPRSLEMREVINANLYVVAGGVQWRMLPKEYPPWQSVYWYFKQWRDSVLLQRMHDSLRARLRQRSGRHKHPAAGCLDSRSVTTTAVAGVRGYDKGKQINGCKRHILVDKLDLLLSVVVTPASVLDRDGARVTQEVGAGIRQQMRRQDQPLLPWIAQSEQLARNILYCLAASLSHLQIAHLPR